MGIAGPSIRIVDEDGEELPPARFDADGRLLNADECVGEIVNTDGAGPFEGYYNNDEATGRATAERLVLVGRPRLPGRRPRYLASPVATPTGSGSTARTSRPGRSPTRISAHPDVVVAVAYGVPDAQAGDQVMAAIGAADPEPRFDPEAFAGLARRRRRHRPEVAAALRAGGRPSSRAPGRTRS